MLTTQWFFSLLNIQVIKQLKQVIKMWAVCLIYKSPMKHISLLCTVGPVQALDFNPFKPSLLASGASDSEIYIWDLANPSNPLTPGSKTLPPDNISCVSWNRQVQHILASASPCGRCVVWDLRKNEPIIKVSDQSATVSNRGHCICTISWRYICTGSTCAWHLQYQVHCVHER